MTATYEMKDSGVQWLGCLPCEWKVVKAKYVLQKLNREVLPADDIVICSNAGKVVYRGEKNPGMVSLTENGYQHVEPGDLLIHGMDTWHGAIAVSQIAGKCTPVVHVCDSHENKTFIAFYLQALAFCDLYKSFSNGIRQNTSDYRCWDKLGELLLVLPPAEVQKMIASYLDDKCGRIDDVVAQAKATIEEYRKWKASLIFETVTKGLDKNAEMKDSGVQWIGMVPKGWKVAKQKFYIKLINGRAYSDNEFQVEGKYRVLRVGNFFTNSKWYYSDLELEADKYCDKGDLLYAWSASYGPKIWDGEKVIYHYHIWKCVLQDVVSKMFCYYYFQALGQFVANSAHGTAMNHITMQMMNNAYIALPPLSEQTAIASYLDSKCSAIDGIIAEKESLITELEAYKKSLIFETVTGKRRVY